MSRTCSTFLSFSFQVYIDSSLWGGCLSISEMHIQFLNQISPCHYLVFLNWLLPLLLDNLNCIGLYYLHTQM
jgi:hypothetical protein